ncbi:MAG: cation diffusion facilitator family transporter [Clostridia bacterium]|nr:cation diffusion facilitator family transporter [Clostridia bacterium]
MTNQLETSLKSRTKKSLIILIVAIVCNVGLAFVKLYVGLSANSLMIMLDAVNSFFDILTAIATAVAFGLLFAKISEKAPFGYGRSEYVAGFVVATVSVVLGGVFFMRSLNRLAMPEPLYFGTLYCILIGVALAVKIGLAVMFTIANRKFRSKALAALMLDSYLDVGITGASLVSFAIASYVDYAVDAIVGIIVSIIIIIFGIAMIADNLRSVVVGDKCEEEKERVRTSVSEAAGVKEVGKVILHDYGFSSKVGTVEIVPENMENTAELLSALNEKTAELKEADGIDVQIVLKFDKE